jgi:hypothetical protein
MPKSAETGKQKVDERQTQEKEQKQDLEPGTHEMDTTPKSKTTTDRDFAGGVPPYKLRMHRPLLTREY